MTTYKIHREGGLWRIEADGKPMVWFAEKHAAEAWLDAQDAQEDRGEVVKELRAIREAVYILIVAVLAVFFLSIFVWNELAGKINMPPQSTPQETQQHGLDSDVPLVAATASRGSSHGLYRQLPVAKYAPRPGHHDRAVSERISLVPSCLAGVSLLTHFNKGD